MKLHDLRPAEGSRKERTRVGRGIAAGKGKTAGRGTKGQKARAGGSIPPGSRAARRRSTSVSRSCAGSSNRVKVDYEIVNVGDIDAAVQRGALETQRRRGQGQVEGQRTDHGQPGHPARRRTGPQPRQAAQDPR